MAPIATDTPTATQPRRWGASVVPSPDFSTLPKQVSGPWVWSGPELEKQQDKWIHRLSSEEVDEISKAADAYLESGKELIQISKEDFQLPQFSAKMAEIKATLVNGIGFFLVKGLPVQDWSREKQIVAYMGLGSYLGDRVPQNGKGHVLGHIKSLGMTFDAKTNPSVRLYQTAQRQYFHSDSCDIVALLCLQVAEKGGESMLTSVGQFYNTLRASYPDSLVSQLFQPYMRDKKNEIASTDVPFEASAPLAYYDGKISVRYDRNFIRTAQRHPGVEPLTEDQEKALDALDKAAEDNCLRMVLEVGDVQFVHNPSLLHDRLAFENSPEKTRHLLRLWLSTGGLDGWKLPWDPECTQRPRGGFRVQGVPDKVPLVEE